MSAVLQGMASNWVRSDWKLESVVSNMTREAGRLLFCGSCNKFSANHINLVHDYVMSLSVTSTCTS